MRSRFAWSKNFSTRCNLKKCAVSRKRLSYKFRGNSKSAKRKNDFVFSSWKSLLRFAKRKKSASKKSSKITWRRLLRKSPRSNPQKSSMSKNFLLLFRSLLRSRWPRRPRMSRNNKCT